MIYLKFEECNYLVTTIQCTGYRVNYRDESVEFFTPPNYSHFKFKYYFKNGDLFKSYIGHLESWMKDGNHTIDLRKNTITHLSYFVK